MTISDKLGSTQKACEESVMNNESLYLRLLPSVNGYNMKGTSLDLVYADGADAMTFIPGGAQGGQGSQGSQGGGNQGS